MASTILRKCSKNCKHEFQDKLYGKGNRVHNIGENNKVTCTVCGNVEKI